MVGCSYHTATPLHATTLYSNAKGRRIGRLLDPASLPLLSSVKLLSVLFAQRGIQTF
jgi:hypothetical protein